MKILYCAGSTLPSDSANSIHVMRMCEALAAHGHDVTLLAKHGGVEDPFEFYGIPPSFTIERVRFTSRWHLTRYIAKASALAQNRVDLIVGRYLYPIFYLQSKGYRFIFETHDAPSGLGRWLETQLLASRHCVKHVVISQSLARWHMSRIAPPLAGKIQVLADAAVDPGPPAPVRAQGPLAVGYAGSWFAGRGVELLIAIATGCPDMEFRLAGGDAKHLAQRGLELPCNVSCHGRLPHHAVSDFLRGCDVLVAPYQRKIRVHGNAGDTSRWFSPLKLFEYMAQGKAIVCSDLPVLREVLRNDDNALLVASDETQGWIKALTELAADRRKAQRLGDSARRDFLENYQWRQRAAALLQRT